MPPLRAFYQTLAFCIIATNCAHAEIQFEETSKDAGVTGQGTTYGASWGDLNGDGWPDIWVGNHDQHPSLYLNQTDGTFSEIASTVWSEDPRSDSHAASWADYDNDGDQDLIVVNDAAYQNGSLIEAAGSDHLLLNTNSELRNVGVTAGIDKLQSSRAPLWYDFNNDGELDLLIVARPNTKSSSIAYMQSSGRFKSTTLDLKERPTRTRERYLAAFNAMLELRFELPKDISVTAHQESAQILDLHGDNTPELVFLGQPLRVYDIVDAGLVDATYEFGWPELRNVVDLAAGDFDNDGHTDLAFTTTKYRSSDLVATSSKSLSATLLGHSTRVGAQQAKGLEFKTSSEIRIRLNPEWLNLSKIRIGAEGIQATAKNILLDPKQTWTHGPVKTEVLEAGSVSIVYDPRSQKWQILNSIIWEFVDIQVESTAPLTEIAPINFEPFKNTGSHELLMHDDGLYRLASPGLKLPAASSCYSIASGDFDNDMDLDLYSVCSGPILNQENLLFENIGKGNFARVANAGGAPGSVEGRGDTVTIGDYDKDGFLDLFVTNGADPSSPFVEQGPHQLFRNLGNSNSWLELDLHGTNSNAEGIGARVEVQTGTTVQFREQTGGMHRFSQNHTRLHFGLGQHKLIDQITIRWPSGSTQKLNNVRSNQILKVTEPKSASSQ